MKHSTSITLMPANSMEVYLSSSTKTTPVMDLFYKSEKEYLVFSRAYTLLPRFTHVSLIVTKNNRALKCRDAGMTATNLKENCGMVLDRQYYKGLKQYKRMIPLWDELFKICKLQYNKGDIVPFEIPCRLNAQIKANQCGFGNIYYGEQLIREGTLYGETTPFAIVAVRIDD